MPAPLAERDSYYANIRAEVDATTHAAFAARSQAMEYIARARADIAEAREAMARADEVMQRRA